MIFDFFLFPLTVCALYILGVGVVRWGKERDPYPDFFYPMAALFAIGFAAVLLNFWMGVFHPVFYLIIGAAFTRGILQIGRDDLPRLKLVALLALCVFPITIAMEPGSDAGLYHLPQQHWIRDEKIVFGLAHLHSRLGFSSFIEYISTFFWVGSYFKLLSYMVATFAVMLLLFLFQMVLSPQRPVQTLAILVTISQLIFAYHYDFEYAATDVPTGILFVIALVWGMQLLLEEKPVSNGHLRVFVFSALFCVLCKASAITIVAWGTYVMGMLLWKRQVFWKNCITVLWLPALLMVIWCVRGVILTGCWLYPVESTCLDVPWAAKALAGTVSGEITAWARQPFAGSRPLHGWSWILDWWLPHSWIAMLSIAMNVVLTSALYIQWFKGGETRRRAVVWPALGFLLISLAIWFVKAPTLRFGLGTLSTLPAIAALALFGFRKLPDALPPCYARIIAGEKWRAMLPNFLSRFARSDQFALTLGCVLVLALGLEFSAWSVRHEFRHIRLGLNLLTAQSIEVKPAKNFGFIPVGEGQCWLVKDCSPYDRPPIHEMNGYRYFLPLEEGTQ